MLSRLKELFKQVYFKYSSPAIPIKWIKQAESSWLKEQFTDVEVKPRRNKYSAKIEKLARNTNNLGPQPLWEGYGNNNIAGQTRRPSVVRTVEAMGNFYTTLIQQWRPEITVEFGTAFGVSGMYFLAGLELNQKGTLLTFEPNETWRELAVNDLSEISIRYESIAGTFEENIDKVLSKDKSIDLAFIDAIHTKEFVIPQLEIVLARSSNHAIIILDDINFSDSMRECWAEVSRDDRFIASAELGNRVGIVEFKKS